MGLGELRGQINDIDAQILSLFEKRMEVCYKVAEYKMDNGLEVFQSDRENEVISRVRSSVSAELADPAQVLFTNLMDISKCRQFQRFFASADQLPYERLELSGSRTAAVPGTVGSYSHAAAKKLLPESEPVFFDSFGEVFAAVESGSAEFGIVPIANSTAGTVSQTYELMRRHDLKICACTKIAVEHCLAIRQDTDIKDVKRVYSHEQALMQCAGYLSAHGYSTRTAENTALAAAFVSRSSEPIAAICSTDCAEHFGLKIIDKNIEDAHNNFTKFILISKKLKLAEDADIISVSLTVPHQASALYRLLTKFSVSGLNLTMIESRPIANTDFDVLFYLDFEGSIKSPDVIKLIRELESELGYFRFLGNYKEF